MFLAKDNTVVVAYIFSGSWSFFEQWPIFVELSRTLAPEWKSEVLYFSRDWINQLKTPERAEISNYLMQIHRSTYN
ncbi:MAG: hypothetical protein RIS64_3720, partial [Bacteroidota bacterium]